MGGTEKWASWEKDRHVRDMFKLAYLEHTQCISDGQRRNCRRKRYVVYKFSSFPGPLYYKSRLSHGGLAAPLANAWSNSPSLECMVWFQQSQVHGNGGIPPGKQRFPPAPNNNSNSNGYLVCSSSPLRMYVLGGKQLTERGASDPRLVVVTLHAA